MKKVCNYYYFFSTFRHVQEFTHTHTGRRERRKKANINELAATKAVCSFRSSTRFNFRYLWTEKSSTRMNCPIHIFTLHCNCFGMRMNVWIGWMYLTFMAMVWCCCCSIGLRRRCFRHTIVAVCRFVLFVCPILANVETASNFQTTCGPNSHPILFTHLWERVFSVHAI